MSAGQVYVLYDVRVPGRYRYVGQTRRTLRARLWEHRNLARTSSKLWVARWIRSIGPWNLRIELLGEYPTEQLDFWECFWMAALREAGHDLTNIVAGGRTGGGFPVGYFHHSPEARIKIGQGQLGRKRSAETRARLSEAAKGRKHTAETIEKLSSREFTEEHRARLREAWVRRRQRDTPDAT